jgi:glycosyltransferase involved in cell wall biosynthesis
LSSPARGGIAINDDMRDQLIGAGQPADRVFKLFNVVRRPEPPRPAPLKSPSVVAAMGRFVAKKGFEVFIEALGRLNDQGVAFRAVLAGNGELEDELKARAAAEQAGPSWKPSPAKPPRGGARRR